MHELVIGGDIYFGDYQVENIAINGNPQHLFGDLFDIIQRSEMSIANLESPITVKGNPIKKMGPSLKASPETMNVLKNAGFRLLTLANNHILDYGREGLVYTLKKCEELGLDTVGAGLSESEVRMPYNFTLGNKRFTVLNFAENEFSTFGYWSFGANPLDIINNIKDIKLAKKSSDFVIVIIHGGREHYPLPSPNFRKTLRFYAEIGADVVVAHHTHCVSGYEVFNNTPIFYGLGNLHFKNLKSFKWPLWNTGMALRLILNSSNQIEFEVLPFYQCKDNTFSIKLLRGTELEDYNHYLDSLNNIITDDSLLKLKWERYLESQNNKYLDNLLISNKFLRKLVNRKLVPQSWLFNQDHKLLSLNLIKCETHREILLEVLENDIYQ